MEDDLKNLAQELLGKLLKTTRIDLDKTQEELGILVGYSPQGAKQAISQLERGISWIPNKKESEFVSYLNLDPNFMQLLNYHFHSRNYQEVIKLLRQKEKAFLNSKTREINLNFQHDDKKTEQHNAPPPKSELEEKLATLKDMFEKDLIDEEEYKAMKKEALRKFLG